MSNYKFHLFQLQKLDSRLSWLNNEIEKANYAIQNDPFLISSLRIKEEASRSHQEKILALSNIENQIQQKRVKLEQSESSLYQGKISNPKELQDLQKEVAIIKNQISIQEEAQLDLLFQVEQTQAALKDAEKDFDIAQNNNHSNNAALHGTISSHENEIMKLDHEKNLIISQLPHDVVSKYDELFNKKRGLVVSKIEEGSCSICGASLTPSENQQAKSPSVITFCPSCGRILYAD